MNHGGGALPSTCGRCGHKAEDSGRAPATGRRTDGAESDGHRVPATCAQGAPTLIGTAFWRTARARTPPKRRQTENRRH